MAIGMLPVLKCSPHQNTFRFGFGSCPARAKLAIAVSWLRRGNDKAFLQAEAEYKDFILLYPNMREAAELQVGEPLRKIRAQKAARPL
jgi:hypothetical protein